MTRDAATELQGQGLRTLAELADLAARDPQRAHDMLQGVLGSAQEAMQASSIFFVHTTVLMHACVRVCMSPVITLAYITCHKRCDTRASLCKCFYSTCIL